MKEYCDKCAEKLDPRTMAKITVWTAHNMIAYYLCPECAKGLIQFVEDVEEEE